MGEEFNNNNEGKSKEEIFHEWQDITRHNLLSLLKFYREKVEEYRSSNRDVPQDLVTQLSRIEKSLENLAEATRGNMRKIVLDLYERVKYLNEMYKEKSGYNKSEETYKNVASTIHRLIDGFGSSSKNLFDQIVGPSILNPEVAAQKFGELLGIEVISRDKFKRDILGLNDPETIADLMEKANLNFDNGVLTETKREMLERLIREMTKSNNKGR